MHDVTPKFVHEYGYDDAEGNFRMKDETPVELKKKFEIWYNKNFAFEDAGKEDPWYTWDARVIEKKDRSKRPEFTKK